MGSQTFQMGEPRQPLALTKQEAALALGVSRTIDRLIALKELHVRRLGRRVLLHERPSKTSCTETIGLRCS
jgi:excisionase family DNA binding protein